MNLLSRPGALRNGKILGNPMARTQIAAAAALAGWHGGAFGNGWWRHGNGGYGWVGPLFWPFAYNDIYDYAIWDDGLGFWGYGYPDIYAGIFPPYGYDDLAGYFPQRKWDRRRGRPIAIGQMCGNDSRAVAGMPVDQIADTVEPNETQLAALSELGQASLTAAQNIRIACPSQAMLTAPGRLAVMQQRVEAMISATTLIQPRLERFYGLLNDEQKARLNALGESQRKASSAPGDTGSVAQSCSSAWTCGPAMADQRDRGQDSSERHAEGHAAGAAGYQRPYRRGAAGGVPGGRSGAHPARADGRRRKAARCHAAGGQAGACRA